MLIHITNWMDLHNYIEVINWAKQIKSSFYLKWAELIVGLVQLRGVF